MVLSKPPVVVGEFLVWELAYGIKGVMVDIHNGTLKEKEKRKPQYIPH